MLLVHIADIHFRAPNCNNPDTDPDRPIRTRMLQDVRKRLQRLGPAAALLVGGDVAFKGDPQEYEAASAWLAEFAEACGCSLQRVFVVPGNHDIDRRIITASPSTRNAQEAILQSDTSMREHQLRIQFGDENSGRALVQPLTAFNEFAKVFDCQVYPPERLHWKQELPLEQGVQLRIHGLTSTLLSGMNGNDDSRGSLYLSPLQTVLDPVEDVVNLVLCHHPPEWCLDCDEIEDAVRGRAAIHLFGHKHHARIEQAEGYIRCNVNAVNPDRRETGWQPGYNLINLRVVGENQDRMIEVEAHVLQWQSSPELFRPVLARENDPVFRHRIVVAGRTPAAAVEGSCRCTEARPRTEVDGGEEVAAEVEVPMVDDHTRNLVYRFWNLPGSQRRGIMQSLGLIEEEDLQLPEAERYGRALLRARKRGLLEDFALEVTRRENH